MQPTDSNSRRESLGQRLSRGMELGGEREVEEGEKSRRKKWGGVQGEGSEGGRGSSPTPLLCTLSIGRKTLASWSAPWGEKRVGFWDSGILRH